MKDQFLSRRSLLASAATAAAGAGLAAAGTAAAATKPAPPAQAGGRAGQFLTVADGTVIHYPTRSCRSTLRAAPRRSS
jgi:hypothetical protein